MPRLTGILPHPLAVFPPHFSRAVPTIRTPGTGYIANNSRAVILTSSSDRVRLCFFGNFNLEKKLRL